MKKSESVTPLMRQYNEVKGKYPGCLVLFRVGDFYEMFNEDAITASRILGIILTKRANGSASHMDLAGFPYHSLDTYLPKLVRAGQRVAICEQLEDPKQTKKLVKRGVTELVSPGVTYNENVLEQKKNNYLGAVFIGKQKAGVSFLDISTGEFFASEGDIPVIEKLLQSFKPSEVILPKSQQSQFEMAFGNKFYLYPLDDWQFGNEFGKEKLLQHFQTITLKGFGIQDQDLAVVAAGATIQYLQSNHHTRLSHIQKISRIEEEQYLWLDRFTIRNLELIQSSSPDGVPLLQVIDKTTTPMGGRLLRRWLLFPLTNITLINQRLDVVNYLINEQDFATKIREQLHQVGDLERLVSKVAALRINPRELSQLKQSLQALHPIKALCAAATEVELRKIAEQINECKILVEKIEKELMPEPPVLLSKGGIIANGVDPELDDYRRVMHAGKDFILKIQQDEILRTGIGSLKVAFNSVFGYYIEVTNVHKDKVPADWIRKQTLTNAERYITQELKEYEEKVLGAEEKVLAIEQRLYSNLVSELLEYIQPIQQNASAAARLDCLLGFSVLAKANNYCRPNINDSSIINLDKSRHPVIEKQLPIGENYIPNDITLNKDNHQIIILTGPNMSGKSALLRQVALAVLMAHMGCYVAAENASIGLVDKVFTRVGASDNLSQGESTFMVEMLETASILNNLSSRSLILLDEIGRGTSTYDGVSLAWAITEFLAEAETKPRTIFATHYHELNELEERYSNIKNYHIKVHETGHTILFLRKLVAGGSEHSFGIHVARLAGIPKKITERSNEILLRLESDRSNLNPTDTLKKIPQTFQLSMFGSSDERLRRILELMEGVEINSLTPIEALMKLNELKRIAEDSVNV